MIDLDDTSNCPLAAECAYCGVERGADGLAVTTVEAVVGVFCLTVCRDCARTRIRSKVGLVQMVKLSLEHCGHLGIDADEMAALMEVERR